MRCGVSQSCAADPASCPGAPGPLANESQREDISGRIREASRRIRCSFGSRILPSSSVLCTLEVCTSSGTGVRWCEVCCSIHDWHDSGRNSKTTWLDDDYRSRKSGDLSHAGLQQLNHNCFLGINLPGCYSYGRVLSLPCCSWQRGALRLAFARRVCASV